MMRTAKPASEIVEVPKTITALKISKSFANEGEKIHYNIGTTPSVYLEDRLPKLYNHSFLWHILMQKGLEIFILIDGYQIKLDFEMLIAT
jgi:hypothetical protein